MIENELKLMNADRLLDTIFEPESRPTKRTLYNWIARGLIPCVRVGTSLFFAPDKVKAALEKRQRGQRKEAAV